MRATHSSARLVFVTALAVSAFAAIASSAMAAVSIEPLNTKFSGALVVGTKAEFRLDQSGETNLIWTCTGASLAGTTNATKTNYVNVTEGFTGCIISINGGSNEVKISNSCTKEGTIPWTVTLNETGTPNKLALNCALVIKGVKGTCTITVPTQTAEHELSWTNVKSVNLELNSSPLLLKSLEYSAKGCAGVSEPELTISDRILINGIHAA